MPSAGLRLQHLLCTTEASAFKCGFALGLGSSDPNSAGAQVSFEIEVWQAGATDYFRPKLPDQLPSY